MKTIARLCCVSALIATAWCAEPALTKAQVTAIGTAVLEARQYHNYHGGFDTSGPRFDSKTGLWSFSPIGKFFPATFGVPLYFFEVRDADGYFRIGVSTERKLPSRSAMTFKKPPKVNDGVSAEDRKRPDKKKEGEQGIAPNDR